MEKLARELPVSDRTQAEGETGPRTCHSHSCTVTQGGRGHNIQRLLSKTTVCNWTARSPLEIVPYENAMYFHICVISGCKMLFYQIWFPWEQTVGTKLPVPCPEETNLSCTEHITWKVFELDQSDSIYCTQRFYEMLHQHQLTNPHPVR